ncbi:MAG: hypothetical protein E7384_08295 [Ruminococcaceae bacterium]|nr:hypothetical protein [Oscillospiraceae bacterium]
MKKFLSIVLCIVLGVSVLTGCGETDTDGANDGTSAPSTSVPTATPEPTPVPDGDIIKSMNLSNVGPELKDTALELMKKEDDATTIYVKDYGAKGDGVTDDRKAVTKAITALKKLPKGSTLVFEPNATYYMGNKGAAMTLNNMKNLIVKGDNTTILIDAPAQYFIMQNNENFVLQGFNFNYKTKPYAFTTKVENVVNGAKEYSIVATLDRSLGIDKKTTFAGLESFGVLNRDDGRYHMSIKSITPVDKDAFKYKIEFNKTTAFHPIDDSLKHVEKMGMIVPVPGIGHSVEQAFTVLNNKNIMMKDCNVWSACKFMFFIRGNEGKVVFDNTNVTPDPAEEKNGDIRIVGWRDGFHCKENRAQLVWKDCTLEWVYDDIFNICCSMLKVNSFKDKNVDLIWPETNAAYGLIKKGDVIRFYSPKGIDLGSAEVVSAKGDSVVLKNEVEGLVKNSYAAVETLSAPNSMILNCKIKGTIRYRTPMYIYNSDIHVTRMWLAFEMAGGRYLEGPCPHDILFSNCNFTFDNTNDKYIEIFSSSSQGEKALKNQTKKQDEVFHVKNIVFFNCELDEDQIELKYAELYCDDVYRIVK